MTRPRCRTVLQRIQERSLAVAPSEADAFCFDHNDLLIAEACLAGCQTDAAIAEATGLKAAMIRERRQDPVRAAWISREVGKAAESRVGNVIGALYARALRTGDPQACKLLLAQFGQLLTPVEKKRIEHLHVSVDLSQMTDEELTKYIGEMSRRYGTNTMGISDSSPRTAGGSSMGATTVTVGEGPATPGDGVPR